MESEAAGKLVMRASARIAAGVGSLLLIAGCGVSNEPLSEEVRAKFGTVAVQPGQVAPKTDLAVPYTSGQAAGSGALAGFGLGLLLGGTPITFPLAALSPVFSVVGAVAGGSTGGTPQEVSAPFEAMLRKACSETDFQKALDKEVATAVRVKSGHRLGQTGKSGARGLPKANSVLEVNVLNAGLHGERYKDGKLEVFLEVRVIVSSWPDSVPLYRNRGWYFSRGERTFQEWAANDARLFRSEMKVLCREAADGIVSYLFLPGQPMPSEKPPIEILP